MRLSKFLPTVIFALSLMLAPLLNSSALGQADRASAALPGQAIRVLANYTTPTLDMADKLLKENGFNPPIEAAVWDRLPAIRKFEAAYASAEAAAPSRGGDKLLALLSRDLARRYEAARMEPDLQPFFNREASNLVFEPLNLTQPPPQLPKQARAAINALSIYTSPGALGAPQDILIKYFRTEQERAYQILRQSTSLAEAYKHAYNSLPAEEGDIALRKLTHQVEARYDGSVWHEQALKPYLPEVKTKSTLQILSSGNRTERVSEAYKRPGLRTPPGRNEGVSPRAAEQYPGFVRKNYTGDDSKLFSNMAQKSRGFGGVVFGNQVYGEVRHAKLISLSFQSSGAESDGELVAEFEDGSRYRYPSVSAEAAYVAFKIVFDGTSSFPAQRNGDGIGLLGVQSDGQVPYYSCDPSDPTAPIISGYLNRVVIHPALEDVDLGWAVLMADSFPSWVLLNHLLDMIEMHGGIDVRLATGQLFDYMNEPRFNKGRQYSLAGWKVVDVPMTISAEGDSLLVSRHADSMDFPSGLLKKAFLELRPFYQEDSSSLTDSSEEPEEPDEFYDAEIANSFYRLLPILVVASHDYDQVNSFAAVMAIFRWAKQRGATMKSPPIPRKSPTPDAVARLSEGMIPFYSYSPQDAVKEMIGNIDGCLSALSGSAEESRLDEFEGELKNLYTRFMDAPEDKPAEEAAWRLWNEARSFEGEFWLLARLGVSLADFREYVRFRADLRLENEEEVQNENQPEEEISGWLSKISQESADQYIKLKADSAKLFDLCLESLLEDYTACSEWHETELIVRIFPLLVKAGASIETAQSDQRSYAALSDAKSSLESSLEQAEANQE